MFSRTARFASATKCGRCETSRALDGFDNVVRCEQLAPGPGVFEALSIHVTIPVLPGDCRRSERLLSPTSAEDGHGPELGGADLSTPLQ
jgi:hypothetical protein